MVKQKGIFDVMYYLIKIKGKANIPDYVQLRDSDFTLVAYCRVDRPEKALQKAGFGAQMELIKMHIDEIPFGKLHPIEI